MKNMEENWTCSCLYTCNACEQLEKAGMSKRDYFSVDEEDRPNIFLTHPTHSGNGE